MRGNTAHTGLRIGTMVLLWGAGIAVIAMNILFDPFLSPDHVLRLRQAILLRPFHPQLHEALGAYYREGNAAEAQREYALAESLTDGKPSGFSLRPGSADGWDASQQKEQQVVQQKKVWERVFQTAPDYTYAALKLAALSYETGDIPGARKYFLIAREQAPWDPTVAELAEVLR